MMLVAAGSAVFVTVHAVGWARGTSQIWTGYLMGALHAAYLSWHASRLPLWQLTVHDGLWHCAVPTDIATFFQVYLVLDCLTFASSEHASTWVHHALYLVLVQLLKRASRWGLLGTCLAVQEVSSIFLNARGMLPRDAPPRARRAIDVLFVLTYVSARIVLVGGVLLRVAAAILFDVAPPPGAALSGEDAVLLSMVLASYVLNCWWLRTILRAACDVSSCRAPAAAPQCTETTVLTRSGWRLAYRASRGAARPSVPVMPASPPHRFVLLLHGCETDLTLWDDVVHALPTDTAVLRVDSRDGGQSDAHPGYTGLCAWLRVLVWGRPPYTIEDLAQDAGDAIDQVWGADARVHVVGHAALGGLVARALAQQRSERTRSVSCVFVAPPPGGEDAARRRHRHGTRAYVEGRARQRLALRCTPAEEHPTSTAATSRSVARALLTQWRDDERTTHSRPPRHAALQLGLRNRELARQ